MMIKRKKLWIAFLVIIIFVGAHFFKRHYLSQNLDGVPIEIAQVLKQDVSYIVDFSARTEASEVVDLIPQVSGQIIKSRFAEGSFVKKGDLLIEIDPRKYQYSLDQANAMLSQHQSQLNYAQKELERYTKLDKNKIVSNEDFEKIRLNRDNLLSSIEQDQSNINNAKLMLEYSQINAPIDGVIGDLNINVGNFVQAGALPLARINNINPVDIVFNVDERVFVEMKNVLQESGNDFSKLEILIRTAKVQDGEQEIKDTKINGAKIYFIDNEVNKITGSVRIKATYPNEKRELWANQFVKVALKLKEIKGAMVVPTKAIQMNQSGSFVYIIENNISRIRYVTEFFTFENKTVIQEGVKEGEIVAIDGLIRLKDGSLVDIKNKINEIGNVGENK